MTDTTEGPTKEAIETTIWNLLIHAIETKCERDVLQSMAAKMGIACQDPSGAADSTFLMAVLVLLGIPHDDDHKPLYAAIHLEFYDRDWHPQDFLDQVKRMRAEATIPGGNEVPKFDPDLSHLCESPIETMFYGACAAFSAEHDVSFVVVPQVESKPPSGQAYRLDFAIPDYRLAIELDGHDYHSTKPQRTADAKRDRELHRRGWTVLRFTGSEIFRDAPECATEVYGVFCNLQVEMDVIEE